MANESSSKEIGSRPGEKKKSLKMQLVISVFGNHAASRDGDDYLISHYNIAPESNI